MRLFKKVLPVSVWNMLKEISLKNWIVIVTITLMISLLVWVFYYANLSFQTLILSIGMTCIFGGTVTCVCMILYTKRK